MEGRAFAIKAVAMEFEKHESQTEKHVTPA
jgi:hypothetical protein